jgi:hypothetical protein
MCGCAHPCARSHTHTHTLTHTHTDNLSLSLSLSLSITHTPPSYTKRGTHRGQKTDTHTHTNTHTHTHRERERERETEREREHRRVVGSLPAATKKKPEAMTTMRGHLADASRVVTVATARAAMANCWWMRASRFMPCPVPYTALKP